MTAAAACEDGHAGEMKEKEVTVSAGMVRKQKGRPLTRKLFKSKWKSLAILIFSWESLIIETDEASFCPVCVLNELRRAGVQSIKDELLKVWHRESVISGETFKEKAQKTVTDVQGLAIDLACIA